MTPQLAALTLLLAATMAGGGYRLGALSASGALAAFAVGALVFGLGGPVWGLLLLVFFVSSSLLTRWREADKAGPAARFSKGGRRDWGQVVANGGVGAMLAALHGAGQAGLIPAHDWLPAFVGVMAAVTADTWATEIGLLSPTAPRRITDGEVVLPGDSGGVTPLGLTAAAAGGLAIGLAAVLFGQMAELIGLRSLDLGLLDPSLSRLALLAPVAGLTSAAFDSLLGATVQAVYREGPGGRETERERDPDGKPRPLARGWSWLGNDGVNFLASVAGALVALALDRVLG
jgi:uncharacterized protein (TIGR00297 family)